MDKVGFWWQRRFWKFLQANLHDPRVINWVVDLDGDTGKTLFAKWYVIRYGAALLDATNFKDSAFLWACQTEIFFNIARGTDMTKIDYKLLEDWPGSGSALGVRAFMPRPHPSPPRVAGLPAQGRQGVVPVARAHVARRHRPVRLSALP